MCLLSSTAFESLFFKFVIVISGRKKKVWERRLMNDFKVAPVTFDENHVLSALVPEDETALDK